MADVGSNAPTPSADAGGGVPGAAAGKRARVASLKAAETAVASSRAVGCRFRRSRHDDGEDGRHEEAGRKSGTECGAGSMGH